MERIRPNRHGSDPGVICLAKYLAGATGRRTLLPPMKRAQALGEAVFQVFPVGPAGEKLSITELVYATHQYHAGALANATAAIYHTSHTAAAIIRIECHARYFKERFPGHSDR